MPATGRPTQRLLLTWSDRGVEGRVKRAADDRGPVLRLLEHTERARSYDHAVVLSIPAGRAGADALAQEMGPYAQGVEVHEVDADDPSDYERMFRSLAPWVDEVRRRFPPESWAIDVLLSSGTPQAQTLWVILVKSGMLAARMLQVIPAAFVPSPHPRAVREVSLDIDGFPEIRALREEVRRLRAEARVQGAKIVARSEAMRALMARVVRAARSELPVLLQGETGAGKELVARALHDGSERSGGPFLAENCGALDDNLLASELFGHEPGAFTGASRRHRGLFEQAHGGTLFLDEIGEMSPRVQAMLLRVLQEGTLRRVGGEQLVRVEARVIAATHRALDRMVAEGTFREDLYYRLRGVVLDVPPLRDRAEDVPTLVETFLAEATRRGQRRLTVTAEALRAVVRHPWPGNVRALRSEVLRWVVFCDEVVTPDALSPELRGEGVARREQATRAAEAITTLDEAVRATERDVIERALALHEGNIQRTARALGIERNTLKRKVAALGVAAPRKG